jgi:regulator of sigma E protease
LAGKGVETIGTTVGTTATYLGRIFTGKESGDLLNGPLGIAKAAGGVTRQAVAANPDPGYMAANLALTFLQFAAIVSIGIGIVNLLPIPVLDGGHLLFYAYEAVARRPVPARVQEVGYLVLLCWRIDGCDGTTCEARSLFNLGGSHDSDASPMVSRMIRQDAALRFPGP